MINDFDEALKFELEKEDLIESFDTEAYNDFEDSVVQIDEDEFSHFKEDCIIFSPQIEVFEPFAAHVDASRTNMSAKQLLQTVVGKNCDTPFIINKNYPSLTEINSPFVEFAKGDGFVVHSKDNFLVVFFTDSKKLETLYVSPIKKMTNNSLSLKYKIMSGEFKKGDILFDYTGLRENNVPSIGYRTTVMYGSFYGYTADDAFVMSEGYSKRATIEYSKKVYIPISKELNFFKNIKDKYFFGINEEVEKYYSEYLKIDDSDSFLSEFQNTGKVNSKIYGKQVDSIEGGTVTDIHVHILTQSTMEELKKEYKYNPGLIDEINEMYVLQLQRKQNLFKSLNNILEEQDALEMTNQLFDQWESTQSFPNILLEEIANNFKIEKDHIDYILEVEIFKEETTCRGDKFANVFAGKGVCSLILPDNLMPKDENGNPVDIIFNPLGLFGRNNWGTIFELALSRIIKDIESVIDDKQATIDRLEFVRQNFISHFDEQYSNAIIDLLHSFDEDNNYEIFKASVKQNSLYFFVDNFPNIPYKRFIDTLVLPYQSKFNINITDKTQTVYSKELLQYMRDRGFISNVFNEDVVEDVPQNVFIGQNYWIKLFHTSSSKYHAVGAVNKHSKITGLPARGRAKDGGLNMSWMSFAALEGHQENNPISVELRTIKSDAIKDKNNYISKMLKDGKYILKDKYESPTVNTLNNNLNMLGLKFSNIRDNNLFLEDEILIEKEENDEFDISDIFEEME
ncbi:MAG: hypothetical protein WC136_00465 [Sphaerochaeta sp.]